MKHLIALIALCLTAHPAFALSCIPADPRADFQAADASPEKYIVVHGKISFDDKDVPQRDPNDFAPKDHVVTAQFQGQSLNQRGFVTPFSAPFKLTFACLASWCGGLPNNRTVLAFLRQTAAGYDLAVGPCGGQAYVDPSPKMLRQMQRCLNGGACKPPRF